VFFGPDPENPLAPSDTVKIRVSGQCYGEWVRNHYLHYGYVGFRGGVWGENEVTVELGTVVWGRSTVSSVDLPMSIPAANGDLVETFYLQVDTSAYAYDDFTQAHAEINRIELLGIDRLVSGLRRRRAAAMMTMERRRIV